MTPTRTSEQDQPSSSSPPALWYTVEAGVQTGPWSLDQVYARLAAREITPQTLCWREGMNDWAELAVALARDRDAAVPNSAHDATSAYPDHAQPESPQDAMEISRDARPHPFRRWSARMIDYLFAGILFGFAGPAVGYSILAKNNFVVGFVIGLGQALVIEPLSFALGGRTVGKALLNIFVTSDDLSTLDLPQAFRRSINVWGRGFGLGLPLISLIAAIHQYQELTRNGAATYDRSGHFRVTHGDIGGGRVMLLIVCALVFLAFWVIGVTSK